ncbi:MAG TPA: Gfo/Idh/MocA family oxidoreductase [Gaiellaceae bacterium]|nr:Gfo/Idh/MocA family oxidoreductase [Gaiellaceae bacterium]
MPVATVPRLGFLGVGWIGRSRLEAIERAGAGIVAAVADPAVDDALGSYDELLERELDGVVIATPSALHAEQAIAALELGLPVFVQKPVGRTAGEVRSVVAAAERADVPLGVDLAYRHADAFVEAREQVRCGAVGDVFAAELVFHNAYGPDKPWFRDPKLAGGGCVIDLGIHLVDLAVWTLGLTPRDVRSRLLGTPVETWATAELDHVRLACSWDLHAGRDAVIEATFLGEDGTVRVANVGGSFYDFRCELLRGTSREALVEPPDAWPGRAAVAWARRVAAGAGFDAAEGAELVRVAEILDRIYGR